MPLITVLILSLLGLVTANCQCGYQLTINNSSTPSIFTDLIETDFLHLTNISKDTDWRRQEFPVTAAAGRGPYGMNFTIQNVISNPILNATNWTGPGEFGGDPGLQLIVDSGIPENGYVQVAEMDSAREDMLWGTYRTAMKLSLVPGTCSAFFWEIDMEFLSSQFIPENNTYPVNLVLQSEQSVRAGYNAAATGNYVVANLPFDPTDGFHEYRIDFVPGNVLYYADGYLLAKMNTTAVPTSPGHMILTQWSNGNPLWSFGPPTSEATITVSYVKAYFNSSDTVRQKDWALRCTDSSAPGAICMIPDQLGPPDPSTNVSSGNSSASTYFFSNEKNMTVNQTIYHKNGITGINELNAYSSSLLTLMLLSSLVAILL
ncbi:Lichenase [Hyphodiscus hymeniophilus]|uniref:Lichenase n=1 Tax=Hyphodiscus hymeniophilus TaxID=353542 RepID=A0A9P6VJN2_9HELO|nr:Lichenase [Hyphodiscus hymeniophilus]